MHSEIKKHEITCWCGNAFLELWNDEYVRCPACGTLVDKTSSYTLKNAVRDDGSSLYDASYWLEKTFKTYREMGCNDINDIILLHYRERAAWWVQHFIRHLLPPARVIEIGCGMGTFSHWLGQLGYDVMATELSPAWRKIIHDKLGINVTDYSLSSKPARKDTFDAVIMMDVFEHIREPEKLLRAVCNELKEDGILMIQMPEYDGKTSYTKLKYSSHKFIRQLIAGEHVFLYSWPGICQLFKQYGFIHIQRYHAIFASDMFFVASRVPLRHISDNDVQQSFMQPGTITAWAALKNYQLYIEKEQQIRGILFKTAECKSTVEVSIKENSKNALAAHPFLSRFTFEKPEQKPLDAAKIQNLIYVRLDAIGDAVLASRALAMTRQAYPKARITVVCDKVCAPLYKHCKYIHHILEIDKNSLKELSGFTSALKKILEVKADLVVNFVRSNTPETLALSLLAEAPLIAVTNDSSNMTDALRDCLSDFAHTLVPLSEQLAEVEVYDRVAAFYGLDSASCVPLVWIDDGDKEKTAQLWEQTGFRPDETIAIYAAASHKIKDYELLGDAITPLCQKFGFSAVALGSAGREHQLNQHICSTLKKNGIPSFNFSGHLSLLESSALLASCRLAVGVETGLAHIAAALGVPHVVILGGGRFSRFMPYSSLTTAVCLPLECYNCNWRCRYSSPWCITGIAPQTVTEAIELALKDGANGKNGRLLLQKPTSIKRGPDLPRWRSPQNFMASPIGQGVEMLRSR